MIAGATRGNGGPALARHLLSRKGGQEVRVLDSRHLVAADLRGQITELVAASRRGRTDRPVHHVHIDPPIGSDAEAVMKKFMTAYEREFGLEDVPRCGVEHIKGDRPHFHIVWSLVKPNGRVADLSHEFARREKISRVTEFECGLEWTKGKHNRAVAQALRKDGRADVADAMAAAGLLDGRRPIAKQTPQERAQAERTAVLVADIRAAVFDAWRSSDTGPSLAAALEERGLRVAAGSRGPILIDAAGAAHGLTRTLSAAARVEGSRITAADVKKRLGGITLPTKEDVHDRRTHTRPSEEPARGDLSGGQGSPPHESAAPPASLPAGRAGEPRALGRDQESAGVDRLDSRSAVQDSRRDQSPRRTRGADAVAVRRLACVDVAPLRARADSVLRAPTRRAMRDRAAARHLARIDVADLRTEAARLAAGSDVPHSEITSDREVVMKGIRPRHAQEYKSDLLEEVAPNLDARPWREDIYQVNKGTRPRIRTRDRGWIEIDRRAGVVRTWCKPGRASELAQAIAEAEGLHVSPLRPAGDIKASGPALITGRRPADLESWWRERGYDAVAADDGVWVDAGPTRLQDIGNQVRVHGECSPEAARAIVLKAAEAWGGEAELTGSWSQPDRDLMWLEAQRAGVRLAGCEPSASARASWAAETSAAAQREETLSIVRASTGPGQTLRAAAGGDVAALARLDPDFRAFVASYLDDDQRAELAQADLADIIPELERFRQLGAEERERKEPDRTPQSPADDFKPTDAGPMPKLDMK